MFHVVWCSRFDVVIIRKVYNVMKLYMCKMSCTLMSILLIFWLSTIHFWKCRTFSNMLGSLCFAIVIWFDWQIRVSKCWDSACTVMLEHVASMLAGAVPGPFYSRWNLVLGGSFLAKGKMTPFRSPRVLRGALWSIVKVLPERAW